MPINRGVIMAKIARPYTNRHDGDSAAPRNFRAAVHVADPSPAPFHMG